jgi:hypothetical protein
MLLFINTYQYIAANRAKCCRYYPSCSEYAKQAIEKYGVTRGLLSAMARLIRCNPFYAGGYDPVK